MSRQVQKDLTIMDAKASAGIGNDKLVSDFRNAVVSISTTGGANMTIKCQTALGSSLPNFAAAQTPTNAWDYAQMVDLEDGNPIEGDTGIIFTGVDDTRQFEVNTNSIDWLNFNVTAYAAGAVTIKLTLTDNE